MPAKWDSREMLALVERSPAAVALQDKATWLSIFSSSGVVEDPVGTAPNRKGGHPSARGGDDLGRFYDTFIDGNEIRFDVAQDLVEGAEVVRDVIIHTRLTTGLVIEVPAYLIYQLVEERGLKLERLRACWDLRRRSVSALASGWRGLYTLLMVSLHMLRVQGVRGVLGYSKGLMSGIFGRGRKMVAEFGAAVNARSLSGIEAALGGAVPIELPAGQPRGARELLDWLGEGARFEVSGPTPAGWLTGFRFSVSRGGDVQRGVGFLEHAPGGARVERVRLFGGG